MFLMREVPHVPGFAAPMTPSPRASPERESVCVCVCLREREEERESVCVFCVPASAA